MKYYESPEMAEKARSIVESLQLSHIEPERVSVLISKGSKSRRTIARIHSLSKALQQGMNEKPFYVIELISERFLKQSNEEQTKTLIHELLHIPHSFAGGFRPHRNYVNRSTVEKHYEKLVKATRESPFTL